MTETFHLALEESWEAQVQGKEYVPESFSTEGFIHCTDGADNVIAVGNRYYHDDARSYVCLVVDVDRVDSPIRYEDEARMFPHIYGPLTIDAVVGVHSLARAWDGTFVTIEGY